MGLRDIRGADSLAGIGPQLRAAREAQGYSLKEIAQYTRIPQRYLEALERGEIDALPTGPYRSGYLRQYRLFLNLPQQADVPAPPRRQKPQRQAINLPMGQIVRGMVLGAASIFALALFAQVIEQLTQQKIEVVVGEKMDQIAALHPSERVHIQVVADTHLLYDGLIAPKPPADVTLEPGVRYCDDKGCVFEAHDRLEVAIANLSLVGVWYNEHQLKPLGAQNRSRRLVFIDDQEP